MSHRICHFLLAQSSQGGALAQALTPEEWREQGAFFFRAQRFNGAAQCFEKTKDEEDHVLLAEARARIHSAFKVQADPYCRVQAYGAQIWSCGI